MRLIFFDEAKDDPRYRCYHIGAVCIDETGLSHVEERISGLASEAFGNDSLTGAAEFHAVDLYHRKGNFKAWHDFDSRIQILKKFIDILSMDEVLRIHIQINCDLLHENQSADEIAFTFLCERANDLVRAKKSLGMLIGDRENDQISSRFATVLSGYRARGTDFEFGREIRNLVDSVHFTHSHLSRFLQLADMYTWLLQFRNRHHASEDIRHKAVLSACRRPGVNLFPSKYKVWPKH